jgi:hypothetical protein
MGIVVKTVKEKILSLFKKDRKMDRSTQIILDYVEGRLNANDFRNILFKDNKLQEKLKRPIFKDEVHVMGFKNEVD